LYLYRCVARVCDVVGCLWGWDETKTNRLSLKFTFGKLKDQLCQETSPLI
jgi:hypothetical protein